MHSIPTSGTGVAGLPHDTRSPEADAFVVDLQAALADAKEAIADAQERQKEYADRRRRDVPFAAGDRVWLDAKHLKLEGLGPKAKFRDKYVGIFPIVRMVGPLAAELKLPATMKIHRVIHVSRLKHAEESDKFPGRDNTPREPPPINKIDGEDAWEVECFVKERKATRRRPRQILVRWVGYGPAFDDVVSRPVDWRPVPTLIKDLGQKTYDAFYHKMPSG